MLQILHEVAIGKFKLRRSLKQAMRSNADLPVLDTTSGASKCKVVMAHQFLKFGYISISSDVVPDIVTVGKPMGNGLSVSDMLYSRYEEQRILYHRFKGLKAQTIAKILVEEERLGVTRQGAQSFLKRYHETRMADCQAMGGHLLCQKMSRRLWRLKCRLVLNVKLPCL